jgi:hypothetical protein
MDQILYWNDIALEANRLSHTSGADKGTLGPTLSSRALAMVHLAMYDAYVGVSRTSATPTTLPHYLPTPPVANINASVNTAIATAAYVILSKLYPSLRDFFTAKHQAAGLTQVGYDEGHTYGFQIAHLIWDDRKADPSDSDEGYVQSIGRGKHHKDPTEAQPINAPFYGMNSKCFSVGTRYHLDPPYSLSSPAYTKSLKQVRGKGIIPNLMGTLPNNTPKRTPEETLIGIFWGYDGARELGTPPRLYNQIVRKIAIARNNSLEENVQLFAMVNVAMGDAGILAWEQKYEHNFWRPIVGIREHDGSMGTTGSLDVSFSPDCDPFWLPLGAPRTNGKDGKNDFTPPFPAYPSGHATFGAAAFEIVRKFYQAKGVTVTATRDDVFKDSAGNPLTFVSDELNGSNKDSDGTCAGVSKWFGRNDRRKWIQPCLFRSPLVF